MKLSKQPPVGYVSYIRKSALRAAHALGMETGAKILEDGLKRWPDELEAAIKWLVMEWKKVKT